MNFKIIVLGERSQSYQAYVMHDCIYKTFWETIKNIGLENIQKIIK